MAQVIDASVAIAWCVRSQATPLTDAALAAVVATGGRVPSPFWFEVLYGLAVLQRRHVVLAGVVDEFLVNLSELMLAVGATPSPEQMIDLRRLASRYDLSIYDAAYLDLALRSGLPLVTRDVALARAAEQAGAVLFTP